MYTKLATMARHSSTLNGPYYNNDPLTYCIGRDISQPFNHGGYAQTFGQNSKQCQAYLADRCARKWDGVCEIAAAPRTNEEYKIRANPIGKGAPQLNSADILLVNTAERKYLVHMSNCEQVTEPFDPLVIGSPMITTWRGMYCKPMYAVDPAKIDSDPVMDKILQRPWIAANVLINIKNTMMRNGNFGRLAGTKLGKFYGLK